MFTTRRQGLASQYLALGILNITLKYLLEIIYIPFCWVMLKKKRTFFNTPLNLHYILQSSPIIMLIKPIYQALEDLHRFKAPPPTRAQVTSTPWRSTSRTPRRRSMQ
jgi:hypothetical protein